MCNKAVNTYHSCHSTNQFVPNSCKTQEMFDKAVNRWFLHLLIYLYCLYYLFTSHRAIPEDLFMLLYCPDKYKSQAICDEAVDDCLAAVKFIPDQFFTGNMPEKLPNALHAYDDIAVK